MPSLPLLLSIDQRLLSHISAVIRWTVPAISFSPELYTIEYDTNADDFSMAAEPQFSGTDITLTDQAYSVQLENLIPGTTYYYRLKIENTFGVLYTDTISFSTRKFTLLIIAVLYLHFSLQLMLDHPGTL